MVSKLLKRSNTYICSNCRMRAWNITPHCKFCGNAFSNWEEVQIDLYNEKFAEELEKYKNESNLSGKN